MFATNIISGILQRYKQISAKYPQSPSFIPNTNGDSFYLIRKRAGLRPVQIRISNHGTYLRTWCDREELGNSVERIDPALCDNISIVFVDDGNDITKDCVGRQDCEDCDVDPCIPQTFEGQNELGNPFQVIQYTYKSSQITPKYINGLVKAISEASVNGEYKDPLANLAKAAKTKSLSSDIYKRINENMNMKKNKQVVRLNEGQLTKMVTEAVKRVLKEQYSLLNEMTNTRWIHFPIRTKNKFDEDILINKDTVEGKTVYHLVVNNGQFNYATKDFDNCLKFARLELSDIE